MAVDLKPMLRFAGRIPDEHEVLLVEEGQSNASPNGLQSEGFPIASHLTLGKTGQDLVDLRIDAGTGTETISLRTVLLSSAFVGAELRLGSSATPAVGYARVTANATATDTFTADPGTNTLTAVGHGLADGRLVTTSSNVTLPGGLAANTGYFVVNAAADTFQLSLTHGGAAIDITSAGVGVHTVTLSTLTVTWVKPNVLVAGTTVAAAYVVHRDMRGSYYENVRVLMPYQPDQSGAYPTSPLALPGFKVPPGITSFSDLAVFLPFTFNEGLEGAGFSEATSANHVPDAVGVDSLSLTGTPLTEGVFAGGYVRVDHASGVSWGRIGDNTTGDLTGITKLEKGANENVLGSAGWSGAGQPTGTPADWKVEVWLPHFSNSPHHLFPGIGFRYPSNGHQPFGAIRNRPRGNTTAIYGARWGVMLPWAWHIATAIGRRVHVVNLAVGSAGIIPQIVANQSGYQGVWGWWDHRKHIDWSPSRPDGCFARLARMITVMAPAALLAEGSTKKAKVYAIGSIRGELDTVSVIGRTIYAQTMSGLYAAYRRVVTEAGMSPYSSAARIPVVPPKIPDAAAISVGDATLLVPTAVEEFCSLDGFAETFPTDDIQRDAIGHYTTIGEIAISFFMADAHVRLIEKALAQGGDQRVVEICNMALSHLGHGVTITSIDPPDGTEEAARCAQFYATARDATLELHRWGFANKRVALKLLNASPASSYQFAYAIPSDALSPFTVLPPGATDDYSVPDVRATMQGLPVPAFVLSNQMPGYTPTPFAIEQDASGTPVLLTNVEDAVLRYTARVVDVGLYPQQFRLAQSWQLASLLAGSLIKGDEGRRAADVCRAWARFYAGEAATQDSAQRHVQPVVQNPFTGFR